eukprot:14839979-Alexandrium_andersonii.AAC.1
MFSLARCRDGRGGAARRLEHVCAFLDGDLHLPEPLRLRRKRAPPRSGLQAASCPRGDLRMNSLGEAIP